MLQRRVGTMEMRETVGNRTRPLIYFYNAGAQGRVVPFEIHKKHLVTPDDSTISVKIKSNKVCKISI